MAMQIKKPRTPAAMHLIGKVDADAMLKMLRTLDSLSAGVWKIGKVNAAKGYFTVLYYPTNRKGRWEAVFGFDGTCWMD